MFHIPAKKEDNFPEGYFKFTPYDVNTHHSKPQWKALRNEFFQERARGLFSIFVNAVENGKFGNQVYADRKIVDLYEGKLMAKGIITTPQSYSHYNYAAIVTWFPRECPPKIVELFIQMLWREKNIIAFIDTAKDERSQYDYDQDQGTTEHSAYLFVKKDQLMFYMSQPSVVEETQPTPVKKAFLTLDVNIEQEFSSQLPIIASLIYDRQILMVATKDFLEGVDNPDWQFYRSLSQQHLGAEYSIGLHIVATPLELVRTLFEHIQKCGAQYVGIWNSNFDVPVILRTIANAGKEWKDILVAPTIPEDARFVTWNENESKPDRRYREADGTKVRVPLADMNPQFVVSGAAKYVDTMCLYRRLLDIPMRNYSLTNVLNRHGLYREPDLPDAPTRSDGSMFAWHKLMQEKAKVSYMVYNVFIAIMQQNLDDEVRHLDHFASNPNIPGLTSKAPRVAITPLTPEQFAKSQSRKVSIAEDIASTDQRVNAVIDSINKLLLGGELTTTLEKQTGITTKRKHVIKVPIKLSTVEPHILALVVSHFKAAGWDDIDVSVTQVQMSFPETDPTGVNGSSH